MDDVGIIRAINGVRDILTTINKTLEVIAAATMWARPKDIESLESYLDEIRRLRG